MTYKKYDILTVLVWVVLGAALIILGIFLRKPDIGERVWWVVMAVGIALAIVGIVSIGFSTKQPDKLDCPYCGRKIVPLVKSSTSHLYLVTEEEEEVEEEEGQEEKCKETKGPEK
jgi:hypothetical protein